LDDKLTLAAPQRGENDLAELCAAAVKTDDAEDSRAVNWGCGSGRPTMEIQAEL
jgi:hypothetical protein